MKRILLILALVAISPVALSQIQTPAPSPFQTIEQKVGLTDVTVAYSRPSMRGRKVFGDLVPFGGAVWRTGANANTTITFSDKVWIGGTELAAGTYAIFSKPEAAYWDVMFYTDSNNWGTPGEWDQSKVAATIRVNTMPMNMDVETFTMTFDDLKHDGANLGIIWERTYVAVPIKVNTDATVTASIESVMSGPSEGDYFSAAVYYLETGKDIEKAKTWIDKAIDMRESPAFWYYRQQSLIYAKAGDSKGAIKAAQTSLSLAQEAGNADYVALNTKSLKEWGAM